tara:strand:- start:686 stop:2155 length:1470 start_codon:yes stop_codon:yes gene_type:complete
MSDTIELLKNITKAADNLSRQEAAIKEGTTQEIILPKGMSKKNAIRHLQHVMEEEATRMDVRYTFEAWPLEGAYGMHKVLKARYGYAVSEPKKMQSFFGTSEVAPEIRRIQTGPGLHDYEQVIWGQFAIPNITGGTFETKMIQEDNNVKFLLVGNIPAGQRAEIDEVAQELREWLKENSIYKGKSITVRTNEDGGLDPNHPPEFLDVSKAHAEDLILPKHSAEIVQALILGPIENADTCRGFGITLNRGSLLHGSYGTGKTLCAMVAANKANQNGWTFFYVDNPKNMLTISKLARRYEPAVVFCEDVDQFLDNRDEKANEIINELDGLTSKGCEVMTIMTTNHLDRINPAVLRQGRMDLILEFPAPDSETVERLVRKYAGDDLEPTEDITEVGQILQGRIPASIAECVRRAKLVNITNKCTSTIDAESLKIAANSLEEHLRLLEPKEELSAEEQDVETIVRNVTTAFASLAGRKTHEIITAPITGDTRD